MPTRTLHLIAVLAGAAILVACAALPTEACTHELRIRLGPQDTTVRVGATYQARVGLSSCGGRKQLSDSFTWTAADAAVVRVDASTGRVTALATGETRVTVEGERYGRLGSIRVTVQAAAP
jgi:uncharacterized protein YjdB